MTTDQQRARAGLDAIANLEAALGALRRHTIGLHIPGMDSALDDAWRALGATESALRQLAGEPADEPPTPDR